MKKIVKLTESDLSKLIQKVLNETHEEHTDRYMFFSNLEQIHRQTGILLEQDKETLHNILENGHDWAQDHIATAKESIDQVFDFLMNETQEHTDVEMDMDMGHDDYVMEGRKKSGTKLCKRGYAAAKSKFKIFPSAYSNGYGVQVCKGTQPGLDGKKRCSPPYC
jgi:septation ring formation regulator EzrA